MNLSVRTGLAMNLREFENSIWLYSILTMSREALARIRELVGRNIPDARNLNLTCNCIVCWVKDRKFGRCLCHDGLVAFSFNQQLFKQSRQDTHIQHRCMGRRKENAFHIVDNPR